LVEFTRLRLTGFKSFVDSTELEIEPGMTGIVGPNGCGKSNLVEALRWVMGETSAKQMRGGEMDELIFGGTRERPARNIAEVSLVMDNATREATAQFNDSDDLEVSRRIERSKGSVYRVNGKDVRAKDVQLLFADLSSGARSTALVSQGRIGSIINAKPAQRRHLLEEAANITGLHSRRHEAELRLKAAENNLERLDDVIQALDVQLQGLKKQARQAARYRTISDSIRAADALVLTIRQAETQEEFASASHALATAERVVAEKEGIVAKATTAQASAADTVPPLRDAEVKKAAKVQRLNLALEQLDKEEQSVVAAKEAAETRLALLREDLSREDKRIVDAKNALSQLTVEKSELEEAQASQDSAVERARVKLREAAQSVEQIEGTIARLSAELTHSDTERAAARQKIEESGLRRIRAERRLDDIDLQLDNAKLQAQPMLALQAEESSFEHAGAALIDARARWEGAEAARAAAQQEDQSVLDRLQDVRGEEAKVRAEIVALQGVLAESHEEQTWTPILDSLTVQNGYETALGAALGDALTAAADETAPLHWSVLPPFATPSPLPHSAQPIQNFVSGPASLNRRLSQVGLVANREIGQHLFASLSPGQRLVTKDGDLWRWDGFVSRSGAPSPAAQRLRQKNRLRDLRTALEKQKTVTAEAGVIAATARAKVETASAEEKSHRGKVRQAENALEEARSALSECQRAAAALESRIASLKETHSGLISEKDEAGAEEHDAKVALEELGDGSDQRKLQIELQSQIAARREDLMDARAGFDVLSRASDDRQRRLSALAEDISSWSTRCAEAERQKESLVERESTAFAEVVDLAGKPEALATQRQALMTELNSAETDRNASADALARGENALNTANAALREAEHEASSARENRVRREATVTQFQQNLNTVASAIEERIGCGAEEVRAQTRLKEYDPLPPITKAEKSLQRLISERDNMGAINLRAEQESNDLGEQLETLSNEREDLIAAIARLRDGIAKLNREGRQRLLKSFKDVDGHFRNLFTTLFGGGRAHLSLTEADDPLEAGLEIMASPPGKRLQNMALLSGGEQALTAIALLFAVFMVNPAPICVLDEVDAPLDDANVDRFCKLISQITESTGTRVVLVTHHRMTMARVDRLFGVTMAERGVSKLVSVNLREAEALRESA